MQYCSFCGKELILKTLLDGSEEKYCFECDHVFFDTPSPAVIVAVTNNKKIILTRSVGWRHHYWGLIAGHIKSGETAEEAATREVHEEVEVDIFNLEIIGTYAAKNRNLLMIGFKAETESDNIRKSMELERAAWFKLYDELPLRPNSIASQVVRNVKSKRVDL